MADRELHLQPRLQCIADCVAQGARLADVGTDHAYLPVWLLRVGRIAHAIASDINEGPLAHARRTAEEYSVAERMDFRLCAGLDAILPGEADTIVIAGMGGETILSILEAAPWLSASGATLLLQPMTKAELLRPRLSGFGLCVASERLVLDKGTIYAVLEARAGEGTPLSSAEAWCGVGLERDPLYGAYARDRIGKLEKAAVGMRRGKNADSAAVASLEADAEALRQKVREWEHANGTGR
ncbi:MAG: SAM-dependent methyltransferase [Ruminococcaceae bacterium]|nr:SAM-dependent methyltransferase [Oscillospiraceae bacterium]